MPNHELRIITICLFIAAAVLGALCWPAPALAQGEVTVQMEASTQSGEAVVANGEFVAYSILVNNNASQAVTDLLILDVLPEGVLSNVQCLDDPGQPSCQLIVDEQEIPEPLGGTLILTTTRQISWQMERLEPGEQQQFTFIARVVGQAFGARFSNIAYVTYRHAGQTRTVTSPEVQLEVEESIVQGGDATLGDNPAWFSTDAGGTLSMDWADMDGDGDLDLALGSTLGATIYRNTAGQMEQYWNNPRRAFGVRWVDVTGDGRPELIVVGEVEGDATDDIAQQPGLNYVYRYNPQAGSTPQRFQVHDTFTSTVQLVRLEAGDFTGNGALDLVASTNAINPECPVMLFVNSGGGFFNDEPRCVSRAATAALKPVDFNNNGRLDLILGQFPNRVRILLNDGTGDFSQETPISVEESVLFLPYDFAWADIDGDGFLDLAAAYPLMREARVYRNVNGTALERIATIPTEVFLTPYALDWGDFNGDGKVDLAIADVTPRIYSYTGGTGADAFQLYFALEDGVVSGQVWSLRGVDVDGDGDLDLVVTDRDGPSLIVSNFRPPLSTTLFPVRGVRPYDALTPASSVAWADVSGDGTLDLLFGAGPPAEFPIGPAGLNSKLYFNSSAQFVPESVRVYNGFGPVAIAYGDVTRNWAMDLILADTERVMLYHNGDFLAPIWSRTIAGPKAVALGDVTGNGKLDLVIGYTENGVGRIDIYRNDSAGRFISEPLLWSTSGLDPIQSVALADYDNDGFLDLAVGVNGRNRIYRNTRDESFVLVWTDPDATDTRAVAWGDHNRSGAPDLAVGNYDGPNYIYAYDPEAPNAVDGFRRAWVSPEDFRTTSLAWGDWDTDGDLDLAVGNYGQQDQIYVNVGSTPAATSFAWLWSSAEALNTTGIAWGDMDGDGDLDLAISQDGNAMSGVYINNYRQPAHIVGGLASASLLNVPSYVALNRPGATDDAYYFSSAEILAGAPSPVVAIPYRVYNPSGARSGNLADAGARLSTLRFEYSLDGGGVWRTATPATTGAVGGCSAGQVDINSASLDHLMLIIHIDERWAAEIVTLRPFTSVDDMIRIVGLGQNRLQEIKDENIACVELSDGAPIFATGTGADGQFLWNARHDRAISDDVRFRVTVVDANRPGPVQRLSASTISPPFRVRGVSCIWPEGPSIQVRLPGDATVLGNSLEDDEVRVDAGLPLQFIGRLDQGTGSMAYTWNFGNGRSGEGQVTQMTFPNGNFQVRMRVEGQPCPQNRERYATITIRAGTGAGDIYLPSLAHRSGDEPEDAAEDDEENGEDADAAVAARYDDFITRAAQQVGGVPAQVRGLTGDVRADNGHLWLRWELSEDADAQVDGYRLYRGHRDDLWPLPLLVELEGPHAAYVDEESTCDLVYHITAWNRAGESLPGVQAYYTPACNP